MLQAVISGMILRFAARAKVQSIFRNVHTGIIAEYILSYNRRKIKNRFAVTIAKLPLGGLSSASTERMFEPVYRRVCANGGYKRAVRAGTGACHKNCFF